MVSAGLEAVTSVVDVCEGRKSVGEAAGDVTVAAIKGGAIGAASAAVSSVAAGATGAALTSAAATGVGAAVTGTAVGAAAVAFCLTTWPTQGVATALWLGMALALLGSLASLLRLLPSVAQRAAA